MWGKKIIKNYIYGKRRNYQPDRESFLEIQLQINLDTLDFWKTLKNLESEFRWNHFDLDQVNANESNFVKNNWFYH